MIGLICARAWVTRLPCFVAALLLACVATNRASAQTFTNPASITVIEFNTQLYPSNIVVSGVSGPVGSISITLHNTAFTRIADIVAAVRAPNGVIYPLFSRCGQGAASAGDYIFVPQGLAPGLSPVPGTYSPTICSSSFSLFNVSGPIGSLEDVLGSSGNVNGTWSLYVNDRAGEASAGAVSGWSITFGPVTPPATPGADSIVYQGRIDGPDGPANGEVVARFRLFDAPAGGNRVGATVIMRVTPENGVFTVPLDFGPTLPFNSGTPLWMEVAIDDQALTPRQPLRPTPYAMHARVASSATTAQSATFATSAATANAANSASSATSAQHASTADFATTAGTATTAGSASTADFATTAGSATSANSASTANTAGVASSAPWSGITGVPAPLSQLAWSPASTPNSSFLYGRAGIGSEPLASSRMLVYQDESGPTTWHIELMNSTASTPRGGIRFSSAGAVEVSNNATAQFASFARLNSTGAWTVASDARLKTDIRPATGMLDAALKLRPVYFHWLHDADRAQTEDFGLIAQEAREVLPQLIAGDEAKESLTVNYSQLSVVAIGAIQELKRQHDAELDAMRQHIDALAQQNAELLRRLERLESER